MAYHDGYAGGYSGLIRPVRIVFYRSPDGHLHPVPSSGRGIIRGYRTAEGFERVSGEIRVDRNPNSPTNTSVDDAVTAVATAWANNKSAAAATLQTALHAALDTAGFRAPDGTQLT